jgi:hypothetical protein
MTDFGHQELRHKERLNFMRVKQTRFFVPSLFAFGSGLSGLGASVTFYEVIKGGGVK